MSEKTEKATAYKLQKAKEQGQVDKSLELNNGIFLLLMLAALASVWSDSWRQITLLVSQLFHLSSQVSLSISLVSHLQEVLLQKLLDLWLLFALIGVLALIIGHIIQSGFTWSIKPLRPDFKRLHPAQGVKRVFSSKSLFETLKVLLKLVLVGWFLVYSLHHELPALINFMHQPEHSLPLLFMSMLLKLALELILILLALAMVDKKFTAWKFAKDNRMTKQELKDEHRLREGDPKIKHKIKQLQLQLHRKTTSLLRVKTADVVITNPTHLAIALQFDRDSMPAPKVICKVRGEMVGQVKKIAARYGVPIIENPAFARVLYVTVELDQWIGSEHFPVAAGIYRDLYQR